MSTDDNQRNTELLDAELPDPRFVDDRYLAWLYDENPDGPAVQAEADEDGVRVAHYALVPQTYRNAIGPAPFLFSLNAVTRSGTQRKGYWSELGLRVFADATAQGKQLVIGVPNEKSTPGAVKYLDYRFLGPMPVKVAAPTGTGGGFDDHPVDEAFLAGPTFDELAATIDQHEAVHWINSYGPDQLRWRLARPHGGYTVHVDEDLVAVSTRSAFGPVPMAVVLKLFPRGPRRMDQPLSARRAVAAICRYHRAPAAVYAGFNALVRVRGVTPPHRLRPAPLNLVVHSFSDEVPQETFRLDTFEFLDLDAVLIMAPPFTFTFDVEDHRPDASAELRLLDATHRVLTFCADRDIVGSVFVVGEVVRDHPGLVKEIAAQGHELGLHGWSHAPITELSRDDFREQTARGRDLLAEVAGQEVVGFRAPTFSLVPETVWATEVLVELGFTYSSSILPAWSPLFGFPGLPRRPFTWPSGLAELPAPILKVGPLGLPVVGGTYLRVLPWPIVRLGLRDKPLGAVPFTYCHPYDADPGEPYWVVPGTGRVLSPLLWYGRKRILRRVDRMLAGGVGPPLRDRFGDVSSEVPAVLAA